MLLRNSVMKPICEVFFGIEVLAFCCFVLINITCLCSPFLRADIKVRVDRALLNIVSKDDFLGAEIYATFGTLGLSAEQLSS